VLGAPITQPHSCDAEAFGSIRWHSEAFRKKYSMLRHITSTSISTNSAFLTSLNKQSRPRLATCVLRPASCVLRPASCFLLPYSVKPSRVVSSTLNTVYPFPSHVFSRLPGRDHHHPSSTLLPLFFHPSLSLPRCSPLTPRLACHKARCHKDRVQGQASGELRTVSTDAA